MRRNIWRAWAGLLLALTAGCATGPLLDNPALLVPGTRSEPEPNPAFVALGPYSYSFVFESVLKTLADFDFEILESNRYDGRVETRPRIAPGLGLLLKPGSPDPAERLLATLQTYRHRVSVKIHPANNGGFFIQVVAYKELEDLARPVRATAGAAIFRNDNTVERQFEVIDPTVYESGWIPQGRDVPLEQAILERLKRSM